SAQAAAARAGGSAERRNRPRARSGTGARSATDLRAARYVSRTARRGRAGGVRVVRGRRTHDAGDCGSAGIVPGNGGVALEAGAHAFRGRRRALSSLAASVEPRVPPAGARLECGGGAAALVREKSQGW